MVCLQANLPVCFSQVSAHLISRRLSSQFGSRDRSNHRRIYVSLVRPLPTEEQSPRKSLGTVRGIPSPTASLRWRATIRVIAILAGTFPSFHIVMIWMLSQPLKAWTAKPDIHWIVPALSGIPYGMGIDLTFTALTNYLTDAYDIYSASALASSVFSRNIAAALLLPLATYPMYDQLGVGWACSLLGFMCLALVPIPFVFIRYGPILRCKSAFCQRLKEQDGREETVAGDI